MRASRTIRSRTRPVKNLTKTAIAATILLFTWSLGAFAEDFLDDFNRPGPDLGPDWVADPEYQIQNFELANVTGEPGRLDYIAVYQTVSNPVWVGHRWPASSDSAGRNQAGFALRLDAASPDGSGYLLYRDDPLNGYPNQWNLLLIESGVPGSVVAREPSTFGSAPGDNSEIRVILSSNASGHFFGIVVDDVFDTWISDPAKQAGNSPTWYVGYLSAGGMNNNIDDFRLSTTPAANLPPGPFDLIRPENGVVVASLRPLFDWADSIDPDPGDAVTYRIYVSTDPGFSPGQTTSVSGIEDSFYAWADLLERQITYYWKVEARDLNGARTTSTQTDWSFEVPNLFSVRDDFEGRTELGPDWNADPGYSVAGGELGCSTPSFDDIAVYTPVSKLRTITWTWSENAVVDDLDAAGAVFMEAGDPNADGYFIFRKTLGSQRWSVFEIQGGLLAGTLNIDTAGLNPIPAPGDEMRVTYQTTPDGNVFECYINGNFDARLVDPNRRQVNNPDQIYGGVLLGQNGANNIEDFTATGIDANLPPGPFDLVAPPNGTLVYTLSPSLEWTEAQDPNPDDTIVYRVLYDDDPGFANPDSLPGTTELSTTFTGPLLFGTSYYWRVRAVDAAGASVLSQSTWSFSFADTLTVTDDFNRQGPELGDNWTADASMEIVNQELANSAGGSGLDLAVYDESSNPDIVQFDWSNTATISGIQRGGLAVMLGAPGPAASGYLVGVDPILNRSFLSTIVSGAAGFRINEVPGVTGAPGAGAEFRVALSADENGNYFDVFVNGLFHSRLEDPERRYGQEPILYAGVALRAGEQNNVDNFLMSAINFGPPPVDFALIEPAHADTGVALQPTLRWRSADGEGMIYAIYLTADSLSASLDSFTVQGDTLLVWPDPLPLFADRYWRVRATNGRDSRFNLRGWHWFRTSATPVELAGLEAIGEAGRVALHWQTALEEDHLGFHVWRAEEDGEDPEYARLTREFVPPNGGQGNAYRYLDEAVTAGQTYLYRVEAVGRGGESEFFGPARAVPLARSHRLALAQNEPNPFNPATTITFELPAAGPVRLIIFDVSGRPVRHLLDAVLGAGEQAVVWDGRNDSGSGAGSGAYFYRLEAGGRTLVRRMLLIK